MHQDFKELLSAFNAGQVRYLIVGGYAVSFHAQPRATKERVGGSLHTEPWVPAEELEEFNRHIVGKIEIVAEFRA